MKEKPPASITYAKHLFKGSTIVFIALVISQIMILVLRMFLARNLSVEEYGFFYTMIALFSFIGTFHTLNLELAIVKYLPEFKIKKQLHKIKSSILFVWIVQTALSFLIMIILMVFSSQIISTFSKPEDLIIVGSSKALQVLGVLSIWFIIMIVPLVLRSTFRGLQNVPAYATMRVSESFFILLFAILFISVFGTGIVGVAFAYVMGFSVTGILGILILRKKYTNILNKKIRIRKTLIKKIMLFSMPLFVGGIGRMFFSHLDTLMIAGFLSSKQAGLYQVARPAAQLLGYAASTIIIVLFPMISEIFAKREMNVLKNLVHFLLKFSFIVLIPATLVFVAFPQTVITLIFGSKYLAASTTLQILALATNVSILYSIFVNVINGVGKPIINTKNSFIIGMLSLSGNLILIPRYGIEGAAISIFITYIVGLILAIYFARKLVKFSVPGYSLIKSFVGGVLTLFLIGWLKEIIELTLLMEVLVIMSIALLFYVSWILITKAMTKEDLLLISRVIPIPKWILKFARKIL